MITNRIKDLFDMPKILQLCTLIIEPLQDKTKNLGFRPGMTQGSLYSHRSVLEA